MKVKLNPAFEAMSGTLGEMVFRELRGKTIVARKASMNSEPTAGQIAHRERFKLAAAYGKSVMANPELRAFYEEIAKSKNVPVFSLTIADYFNAPTIDNVDTSAYVGQPGNTINVSTGDDFGVVSVVVVVTNPDGTTIERGDAVEYGQGSGHWVYTATTSVPNGTTEVNIHIVATDRPGGLATSISNKRL